MGGCRRFTRLQVTGRSIRPTRRLTVSLVKDPPARRSTCLTAVTSIGSLARRSTRLKTVPSIGPPARRLTRLWRCHLLGLPACHSTRL
uniref:Uncharacterized protein n=1 Tax=Hyaloperonospora arabidopsidis (strain Emoy2) TaxID=559515 RepID=M4BQH2_HYAAE